MQQSLTTHSYQQQRVRNFSRLTVKSDLCFCFAFYLHSCFFSAFPSLVCVFLKKVRKKLKNFYFKIIIRFRTSSCLSDFFGILRLRKVVELILVFIFIFCFLRGKKISSAWNIFLWSFAVVKSELTAGKEEKNALKESAVKRWNGLLEQIFWIIGSSR